METKYVVVGSDIFGTELECREDCGPNDVSSAKDFYTDDPALALKHWFIVNKRYPTCAAIIAKTRADAITLMDAAKDKYLEELYKEYPCPQYDLDMLKSLVKKEIANGCKYFYQSEFGDQVGPFSYG